jgi:phage repressor protein C with HTH and peptisase S24 domain
MEKRGFNQKSLADDAEVSRRTVKRHLERENPPADKRSKGSLDKIADALGVRYEWLARGEGPREKRRKDGPLEVQGSEETALIGAGDETFELRVFHDIEAGAANDGHLNYHADLREADEATYSKQLFHDLLGFWPPDDMDGVYARGASMEPGVKDERLVLYEPVNDVVSGERYVLHIHDPMTGDWYTRVKRLQRITGGGLRIVSDNPSVPDEVLVLDDDDRLVNKETNRTVNMSVIGRVLWPTAQTKQDQIDLITRTVQQLAASGKLQSNA